MVQIHPPQLDPGPSAIALGPGWFRGTTVAARHDLDYDRPMTARAALVLGFFLVLAALVHGGFYSAGHDFVVNRFTGHYEFVPADDYDDSGDAHRARSEFRALTSRRPAARVDPLQCRR